MNSELLLSRTPDLVNAPAPSAASAAAAPARPLSTRSALRALRTDRWTGWHAFCALLMAGLGVLATWTAWTDIFHIAYHDDEYSHIFLVPVVAACTVWVRRMRFRHCKPSGT